MAADEMERRSVEQLSAAAEDRAPEGGEGDAIGAHPRSCSSRAICVESLASLFALLDQPSDPAVIKAGLIALGGLKDWRGLTKLVSFADHEHPLVRYGVAFALGCRVEPLAIGTLIRLTGDHDDEVRNWALFGLSQNEADSPELRDALYRRFNDGNEDIRDEALFGLARRRDDRAAAPLIAALRESPDDLALLDVARRFLGGDATDVSAVQLIVAIERMPVR